MRDGTLIQEFEKVNKRLALVLTQFEWLEQRQTAYEQCISASTWKQRIVWIWNPERFLQLVDAVHLKIHQIEEAKMKAAMEKKVIKPVSSLILP